MRAGVVGEAEDFGGDVVFGEVDVGGRAEGVGAEGGFVGAAVDGDDFGAEGEGVLDWFGEWELVKVDGGGGEDEGIVYLQSDLARRQRRARLPTRLVGRRNS